jgi:signal transduction histidine kinase/ActR/RegA family two-component response regulator
MTTFGFIVFARVMPSPAHGEGDVTLAEELARRAALAMDNARLYTEAREASRLKDDFLALISHELRTPLMPILGWAQLLTDPSTPPDVMSAGLSTIERNARNQAQLIDDLLDVSRIMTGKLYLEPNMMRLDHTVREAVAALRTSAAARRVNLHYHAADNVSSLIGDPTRLQQVATNLISNAIKFTPAGGNVIITVEPVAGRVILRVTDTGQGIEPDFLPYVFDRFRQAESATTRKHGGLGLGLSIVRDIIELHGGSVTAESDGAGRGSTFTVQLPEAPADLADAFPPVVARELPAVRLEGTRVLLVGEEADSKAILTHQLKGLGAKVSVASTDEEALDLLKRDKPSVVLCDMPANGVEGPELLKKIRALPAGKGGRVPAIALSAFTRVEDREWSLRAGFDRHVSKPANVVDLSGAIASLVAREGVRDVVPAPKRRNPSKGSPRGQRRR